MHSKLEALLLENDGSNVSCLSEARAACRSDPAFHDTLAALSFDARPKIAEAATWILKAETEDGLTIASSCVELIADALDAIPSWQAQLHICQAIEGFECTAQHAEKFTSWAEGLADHPRPFLRAWSLSARVFLAQQFPELRKASRLALRGAAQDPAASVRARARQLTQKYHG